jgi:hypothetical protein
LAKPPPSGACFGFNFGLTSTTMAEQTAKRQKLEKTAVEPLIGTHNGTFHCDEALAISLLRKTATFEHSREFD